MYTLKVYVKPIYIYLQNSLQFIAFFPYAFMLGLTSIEVHQLTLSFFIIN